MDISKITTYQSGVVQSAAYRNLHKHFTAMLKPHQLTCTQWFVVGTILDAGPDGMRLTDLANKLQTGLPFITNIINVLESKNMVERKEDDTDSRVKCVSIVPGFEKECHQIEKQLRDKLRTTIYADITPEELRTYIAVLYKLSNLK